MAIGAVAFTYAPSASPFSQADFWNLLLPHICLQTYVSGRNLRCPYDWMDSRAFRIRHYRSKSLEEYVKKRLGGDSAYQARRYTEKQLTLEWLETNARCGKAGR